MNTADKTLIQSFFFKRSMVKLIIQLNKWTLNAYVQAVFIIQPRERHETKCQVLLLLTTALKKKL